MEPKCEKHPASKWITDINCNCYCKQCYDEAIEEALAKINLDIIQKICNKFNRLESYSISQPEKSLVIAIQRTNDKQPIEGAKRQYLPYEIIWICPKCDKQNILSYADYYLMYPMWGKTIKETLYCENSDCNYEKIIYIKPDITLQIVDEPKNSE